MHEAIRGANFKYGECAEMWNNFRRVEKKTYVKSGGREDDKDNGVDAEEVNVESLFDGKTWMI